jgi:hypothetical protein
MQFLWKWTLVLAVPALVAADQPAERNYPSPTTVNLILLRQRSVQEDLKVSAELGKKIDEFTNKEYLSFQEALKLGDAEREAKIKELGEANDKFLAENLSEGQRKRLDQIRWQVTGLHQLTKPEVAKLLGLTEEQQQKFKEMHAAALKQLEEVFSAREGKNEKFAKLRAEIDKKVEAALTEEQKAKARELVGERFTGEITIEAPE